MKRYVTFTYTKEELSHVFVTDRDQSFGSNQIKYSIDSEVAPSQFMDLEQYLGLLLEVDMDIDRDELNRLFSLASRHGEYVEYD